MDSNSLQFWDKLTTKAMWLGLVTLGYLSVQKVYDFVLERDDEIQESQTVVEAERNKFKMRLIESSLKNPLDSSAPLSPTKRASLKRKIPSLVELEDDQQENTGKLQKIQENLIKLNPMPSKQTKSADDKGRIPGNSRKRERKTRKEGLLCGLYWRSLWR